MRCAGRPLNCPASMTQTNRMRVRTTTFEHDDNDRLMCQVGEGPPLAYDWSGAGETRYARAPRPPSKYAGYGLGVFAVLTLGALLTPVRLLWPARLGIGRGRWETQRLGLEVGV